MTMLNANILQIYVEVAGTAPTKANPREIIEHFKKRLEKKLLKKGRTVQWMEGPAPMILGLHMDAGNQMLRYLLPFASPAVVEVKGKWDVRPMQKELIMARGASHFGLFGGSATGMLKVAAQVAADRTAKAILKVTIAGFEPVMK